MQARGKAGKSGKPAVAGAAPVAVQPETREGYAGIDCFRLLAAALVVAVHTSPLLSLRVLPDYAFTRVLARLAVPFFLAATGFFLLAPYARRQGGHFVRGTLPDGQHPPLSAVTERQPRQGPAPVWRFVKKTALLYAVCILLYLPVNFYAGHWNTAQDASAVLRMIFIDGTMYHLWYLPAAIVGVLLVWLFLRYWGLKVATVVAAALYAVGLLGDSYYGFAAGIPLLKNLYDAIFTVSSYTRNGLFYAPVFLLMGVWAAGSCQTALRANTVPPFKSAKRHNLAVCRSGYITTQRAKSFLGLCLTLLALFLEGAALYGTNAQRHDSMYVMLPVCVFFLLVWLGTFRGTPCKTLRDISLLVYILHPGVIVLLRGAAKWLGAETVLVENSIVHYLLVCGASFAAAGVLVWGKGRLGRGVTGALSVPLGARPGCFQKRFDSIQNPHKRPRRAWMEIDLNELAYNISVLRKLLPPGCKLMPAVKANAYGLGAVPVARALQKLGIQDFCVATLEEGMTLRRAGLRGGILILGYTHPDDARLLKRYRLTQTVVDWEYGQRLAEKKPGISAHIKVDTGMRRLGERSEETQRLEELFSLPGLRVRGVFTQLACCDSQSPADIACTNRQMESFAAVLDGLARRGIVLPKRHIQCSYGILNYPAAHADYARPGLALYGIVEENRCLGPAPGLVPIFEVKARIALVKPVYAGERIGYGSACVAQKDGRIAVMTMGYADGLPRNLSNGAGKVLLHGQEADIVGNICMDQSMVDVSHIPDAKPGDVAVIIGKSGERCISVCDVAAAAGTIPNEITSRMGARLVREYLGDKGTVPASFDSRSKWLVGLKTTQDV